MKRNVILKVIIFSLLTGCFASMPVINNAYIENRSDEEKTALNQVKLEIIAINKAIREIEKSNDIAKQKYEVIKKRLKVYDAQLPMLEELKKLYILLGDSGKLQQTEAGLKKTNEEIKKNRLYLDYFEKFLEYQDSLLEEKHALMSTKIAQSELEKAYILSPKDEDIISALPEKEKKSLKNSPKYKDKSCAVMSKSIDVNVCDILEHYNKRKEKYAEKQKDKKKSYSQLKKIEERLKKGGGMPAF